MVPVDRSCRCSISSIHHTDFVRLVLQRLTHFFLLRLKGGRSVGDVKRGKQKCGKNKEREGMGEIKKVIKKKECWHEKKKERKERKRERKKERKKTRE